MILKWHDFRAPVTPQCWIQNNHNAWLRQADVEQTDVNSAALS